VIVKLIGMFICYFALTFDDDDENFNVFHLVI